ncbi:protein sickie-like [Culex pipiens pallens]|uniref:protein sickie-like n=1 Tax=Culex pipiens pallens TaxID=42434 RepID=UPI001952A1FB|nr:protein sickie-like [Culex pipiens pallens]XP_052563477.1 protein sickie-like [Culex pipiens pallens]
MSVAKPEGFATIRTRGLSRSTSRSEQLAGNVVVVPNRRQSASASMKSADSGPLYENAYKSSSAALICVPPPVPPRTSSELSSSKQEQKENRHEDDDVFCTAGLTYETFKPVKSPSIKEDMDDYVSLVQSSECIDRLNYDFELPPLKSPQYITELKFIQSKAMDNGSLFSRPESPPYGKIRTSYRSSTPESVDNCSSGSSTYSNSLASGKTSSLSGFILSEEPVKTGKSATLQYRKSYSNSRSEIIYEEPKKLLLLGSAGQSSDTDSGYDGSQSNSYLKAHKSAELLNGPQPASIADPTVGRPKLTRGYSTLGHPRDVRIAGNGYPVAPARTSSAAGESKSTSSLNEVAASAAVGKQPEQLLDHKVGSLTTLRSKPIIPWYELAIRKDHRQSCPPLQAHVVAAFEQSLVNVSQKLQKLNVSNDAKDNELQEMRQTIELLRQQSAGIAATQLLALSSNGSGNPPPKPPKAGEMKRHHSTDSVISPATSSMVNPQTAPAPAPPVAKPKKKSGLRHSLTRAFSRSSKSSKQSRPVSQSSSPDVEMKPLTKSTSSLAGPAYPGSREDVCVSAQSFHNYRPVSPANSNTPDSISSIGDPPTHPFDLDGPPPVVEQLVKQLRAKDSVLTDIRLEALTTASQVECLKDTVMKMRAEMMNLKQNNERLQQIVTRRSMTGSDMSLGSTSPTSSVGEFRRYSAAADYLSGRQQLDLPLDLDEGEEEDSIPPAPAPEPLPEPLSPAFIADMSPSIERSPFADEIIAIQSESMVDSIEGKKVAIAVYLGQLDHFGRYLDEMNEHGHKENGKIKQNEFTIAFTYVSAKTGWQGLDYIVRRSFKDFLERVDAAGNLGLSSESIASYHLGEAKRAYNVPMPELLPYGYIIGNVDTLYICLRGVSNVALDNLIIKNMVLRYKSSSAVITNRHGGSADSIAN